MRSGVAQPPDNVLQLNSNKRALLERIRVAWFHVHVCCPSQEQKEQPAVQVMQEVQASQGVLAGFLSFLWEDKVTWADRLAEYLNSQNLDAWEERQVARYEGTQSTIR